jgi:hypothetical protein
MPTNLPTKTPDAPPDKLPENKFDPFRPEMPNIPGVSQGSLPSRRGPSGIDQQSLLQIGGIAAVVVLIVAAIFWWVRSKPQVAAKPSAADVEVAEQAAPIPPLPSSMAPVPEGPTVAATADQLSKPWDSKKFTFVKPLTHQNIEGMVIRLPGGGLWAFALLEPYGRCKLEFVTDLGKLASKYKYSASHPMVVNPCDSTVYDPLKVGSIGGDTWARGEIVQGAGMRPPISIDVKETGRSIIADNVE